MTKSIGPENPPHDHAGDSLSPAELVDGLAGDGNTISGLWGDAGEVVIVDSVTSSSKDMTTTSTGWDTVYAIAERALVDWSEIDYTNLGNFRLIHGFYGFAEESGSGTAHLRLNTASTGGTAPSPVQGSETTISDGATVYRRFTSLSIDDPSSWGEWTPMPEIKASDSGECHVQGLHSVILTGEIL